MILSSRYRTLFESYIQTANRNSPAISVFCKSLYAFLILKIGFLWPVLSDSKAYLEFEVASRVNQFLYAPIILAQYDLSFFLIITLVLLLAGLVWRVNYITSVLIFWFSVSLSKLAYPFVNGSDYVLNLFLFLSIFLSPIPALPSDRWRNRQIIVSNFTFLFCKIQLSLIYIFSGMDKLTSTAWRSGDAIYSILNLELFVNPHVSIPASKGLYLFLAWIIILFELLFPVLIWFRQLRGYALFAGIIFHLAIMFTLSLPDFGLIMILLYSLFIPFRKKTEADYASNLR